MVIYEKGSWSLFTKSRFTKSNLVCLSTSRNIHTSRDFGMFSSQKKVLYKFIDMVQQVNFGSEGMSTRHFKRDMSIITSEIREGKCLYY